MQCSYRSVWIINRLLGNTIAQIAEKKAGIIKPGCSVVTVGQEPEALEVIENDRGRGRTTDVCVADVSEAEVLEADFTGQRFCYKGEEYTLSLAGSYQTENAVLALEAFASWMREAIIRLWNSAMKDFGQPAGTEDLPFIHKDPLFIVDGAHNPAAADMLEDSVRKYFKDRRLFFHHGSFLRIRTTRILFGNSALMQNRSLRSRHRITRGHFRRRNSPRRSVRTMQMSGQRKTFQKSSRGTV